MCRTKIYPSSRHTLKTIFGFEDFRQGQAEIIGKLLDGKSTLAVFPTGGGKSLCYQLPALHFEGLTLVISPLIALMKDQIDFLLSKGIEAARLDSSLDREETIRVWDGLSKGTLKLLYVAPERLSNERFIQSIRTKEISLLVIDEAHCISEWGHNFRPDYLKLAKVSRELGIKRVLALTATATPKVVEDIRKDFDIKADDYVNTGFYRPNLELRIYPCHKNERDNLLLKRLQQRPRGAAIIYVTLQRTSERVAMFLQQNGFEAKAYHAGMETDDRNAVQDWFMNSDKAIVVATIAFGMGIDKADIRYVYHYNLPKAVENYVQEIGRAGRDGLKSVCEMFACLEDVVVLENFSYGDTPTMEALQSLIREILSLGKIFDISLYDLSLRHDTRVLVVSTLLTYLELEGIITAVSPFYNEYKFQLCKSVKDIFVRLEQNRVQFLQKLFRHAVKGKTWFSIDIDKTAKAVEESRERIVSVLSYLEEEGDIILKVSGLRYGYKLVDLPNNTDELIQKLADRFFSAEKRNIERMESVLNLAKSRNCLVSDILSYFGENLGKRCGHCDRCLEEKIPNFPAAQEHLFGDNEKKILKTILTENHPALSPPRQLSRFLCGLSSPATIYIRPPLSRHHLFGSFDELPFKKVFDFVKKEEDGSQAEYRPAP